MAIGDKWVFETGFDFTLVLKPTTRKITKDEYGNEQVLLMPPVKVKFVGGLLVVSDALADRLKLPVKTIADMVMAQPGYGRSYFLVQSPEKLLSKEEAEEIESKIAEQAKGKGPKVTHGVRTTGSRTA